MKANAQHIKIIHCLKSALKLSQDNYLAILSGYGVESSKELPADSADDLITKFETRAIANGVWKKSQGPRRAAAWFDTLGDRPGMASRAQCAKINTMWNKVSRAPFAKRKEALDSFLTNHFGITRAEWLPIELVPKVIATLHAMLSKKESN